MLPDPSAAESVITGAVSPMPAEDCALAQAHGRVLREPVRADRAMPPFDRVTMDGFALRATAVAAGVRVFRIIGVQAAGMIPLAINADDDCVEIATGAVLPVGADVVVPYEETQRGPTPPAGERATVMLAPDASAEPGRNVHRRGSDAAVGDVLLPAGTRLRGGEIAVAAACGATHVTVATRPSIAVVATGDELVDVDARELAPHQIRKSNDHALRAALAMSGLAGRIERFHLRDLRHEVETVLRRILSEFDVVLLAGGVSKGKFDFIPAALVALGVEEKLRGVAQRPGKPMTFGLSPRRGPIFALPGNPISAYTCLHRYVLPALARMAGVLPSPAETVVLAEAVRFTPPLAYLLPVRLSASDDGRRHAKPEPFNTSGDLAGLVGTDGFVELPANTDVFPAGSTARFWRWT